MQGRVQLELTHAFDRVRQLFYAWRRRLATCAVFALVLFLGFHVIFGANGMMIYTHKRADYHKLQLDTQQLEEENQRLTHDVDQLKNNPKAIEREAREQLHYTKKGEMVYLLPEKKQPEPPTSAQSKPRN
ncbi:MAG TPA: septum formation initiator family protein [Terriglobales bacterium]|nr:septum formation initiator family protein [Terriglobales bacterium]